MPNQKIFNVTEKDSGKRLDTYLYEKGLFTTRSQVKKLIDRKYVSVDGKNSKAGIKIKKGSVVEVKIPDLKETGLVASDIELDFIFEDSSIVVINKQPGLVVHPAPGHETDTLVNAVLSKVKNLKPIMGELRPGIVHRLDKDTSGVIIVAKNQESLLNLSKQFKDRKVKKIYQALVIGEIPYKNFRCDKQVVRSDRDRKKMAASAVKGRKAQTFFSVVERFKGLSYVEAQPKTGRTHQIRVHLANEGYPIVGDNLYLKSKKINDIKEKNIREKVAVFPRQALHASMLELLHPENGKKMRFEAPLPEDMKSLLKFLRSL